MTAMAPPFRKLALVAALIMTPVEASADEQARWTVPYAATVVVDAAQTCAFARPGAPYAMEERTSAWAIGRHPTCLASSAWIVGVGAAFTFLVPHNRFGLTLTKSAVAVGAANSFRNARLMASFRL